MKPSQKRAAIVERRDSERTPTALRGKVFPGALDCVINDFSRRGARLGFPDGPPADDDVVVVIWTSGFAFEAQARWRTGREMGVQFRSRLDLRGTVPPHLAEVKVQWLNRRRRLSRRQLLKCDAMIDNRGSPRIVRLS